MNPSTATKTSSAFILPIRSEDKDVCGDTNNNTIRECCMCVGSLYIIDFTYFLQSVEKKNINMCEIVCECCSSLTNTLVIAWRVGGGCYISVVRHNVVISLFAGVAMKNIRCR